MPAPVSPLPIGLASDRAMAASPMPGVAEVEPVRAPVPAEDKPVRAPVSAEDKPARAPVSAEDKPVRAPVSAEAGIRSGGEAWSADDDVAAEIAASVSFEPSVASERVAE